MSKNESENEIDSVYRRQQMKIRNERRRKSQEEQYLPELKLGTETNSSPRSIKTQSKHDPDKQYTKMIFLLKI
jgi:hypothetical protein